MTRDNPSVSNEIKRLQKKLQEAEDLIDAIRTGRIDALVVSRPDQDSIYTLKGADHTYRVLIETMDEGALILSKEGAIIYCNRSFADMIGTSINQVTGNPIDDYIASQDMETFRSLHNQAFANEGSKAEINLISVHGGIVPALVSLRPLPMDEVPVACMVVTNLTVQKTAEAKLSIQNEELKWRAQQLARLSSQLTMAEQRERRRLADMLHDHLQQLLAGARLNLEFVSQESVPAQHPAFKDACDLVAQSLETSRTLCAELSPPVLYMQGLAEALQWLARWMEKTHKLQVDLHVDPRVDANQEDLKILLFQSVRELLFNVVKYAGTGAAQVEMKRRHNHIIIIVSDKGAGFDPEQLWQKDRTSGKGGYGLFNVRERLLLAGGAFHIRSSPAGGTTVTLNAPLQGSAMEPVEPGTTLSDEQPHGSTRKELPKRSEYNIQVMLADDHAVMRQGLSLMLSRHDDIEVVGEAADGGQAVEMALRMNPDVILMDISMPVIDGIEATRIIRTRMPQTKIIALSMHEAEDQASAIKNAGAVAYLSKSGNPDDIVAAIRQQHKRSNQTL